MNRKYRIQRVTALLLIFLLVTGSVTQAIASALSGTVKEAVRFTFTYVGYTSTNYHFTLESEDDKTWYGTCMDPDDQGIPYEGMNVSMSKVADDNMIAKIAYEGTQRTDLSIGERRYIISRAAAYHLGRIDSYSMVEDVDKLLKAAKNRPSIPEDFVVYKTAESDYGQQILAWRNLKPTTIQVNKKSETTTSYSLAGAKYGLYATKANADNDTNRIGTLTTDKNGNTNTLTMYYSGEKTYYVKEVKAPDHFGLDDKVYSKTIKEGGSWTISSTDSLLEGSMKLKKVTTVDPVPEGFSIAGAVYGVYRTKANANSDVNRVKTLTTKENGVSNTVKIDAGTYYVKEVSCPDWLLKDKTVHTVTVTADKTATVTSTDLVKPGYVKLKKKVDGPADYPIAGAEYGIYGSEKDAMADADRIGTLITDASGNTNSIQVDAGKNYYVKEQKAPAHYQLDENIYTAYVPYGDYVTVTVTSEEKSNPGRMQIAKTTETTAPHSRDDYSKAGARYGIFLSDADAETLNEDLAIGVLVTDASGNTPASGDLQPGIYYVRETKAPAHLELDPQTHIAKVTSDEITTIHSVEPISTGTVKVKKTAAHSDYVLSECGAYYSLAGAEYTVYTSPELTAGSIVGTLVTDENGNTDELELTVGEYWIMETKASPGFSLDGQGAVRLIVERNQVIEHQSAELPLMSPVDIVVNKTAGNHNDNVPSLAGARFQVQYYPVITEHVEGLKPVRTWLFESKLEDGEGVIRFHDNYRIGGDELYKDEKGMPAGPIGTYVITEVKAPAGYIMDPAPRYAYVNEDGTVANPKVSYVNQPTVPNMPKEFRLLLEKQDGETGKTAQGDAALKDAVFGLYRDGRLIEKISINADCTFTTPYYNVGDGSQKYTVKELTPPKGYLPLTTEYELSELEGDTITAQYTTVDKIIKNDVIKGKIAITKTIDAKDETGELTPEIGVEFEIYLASAGSYTAAKDGEKETIVTDASGFAETKMLPYGVYIVHQKNAYEGYEKIPDFKVEIHEHNKTYRYTINDKLYDAEVRVVKVDGETGKVIPVGGAVFKLRKAETETWLSFLSRYPFRQEITEFKTDETGTLYFPEKIKYGAYELVETAAPYGYVAAAAPFPFVVDGSKDVIELQVENKPQKGVIEISKTGEILKHITANADGSFTPVFEEAYLQGVQFDIFARTDIVTPDGTKRYVAGEKVDTVITGADGKAESKPLYLGQYEVKETVTVEHHVLDPKKYSVSLTYDGQKAEVSADLIIKNDRQKAAVTLMKNLEKDLLYGYGSEDYKQVQFAIFADETITAQDGTSIPEDGLIETIGVTEVKDGCKGIFTCDLPHGSFYVKEVKAAEGYILDDTEYAVHFDYKDQNTDIVNISVNDSISIENKIIRGDIAGHKVDESGADLSGAVMGLFKAGETVFTEETTLLTDISDKNGEFNFQEVAYGNYIVREISAPAGYALNTTEYPVTVETDGQLILLEVINKIEKIVTSEPESAANETSPETGDPNHPVAWMILAMLGIGSLIAGTRRKE